MFQVTKREKRRRGRGGPGWIEKEERTSSTVIEGSGRGEEITRATGISHRLSYERRFENLARLFCQSFFSFSLFLLLPFCLSVLSASSSVPFLLSFFRFFVSLYVLDPGRRSSFTESWISEQYPFTVAIGKRSQRARWYRPSGSEKTGRRWRSQHSR